MEFVKIQALPREGRGKGPAARLRREGRIPAVAYGIGSDVLTLSIVPSDLVSAMKGPFGLNAIMEIGVAEAQPFPALVRDYTYHPLTRDLLHVDFLRIDLNKPVEVEVPFVTTGKAVGVAAGGVLRQVYRKLPISCLPKDVPTSIEHDVTALEQGTSAKAADVVLPPGVTIRLPADQTVVAVVAPELETAETAVAGEGAAGAAEGAAAAPAAAADAKKGAPDAKKAAPDAKKAAPDAKKGAPEAKKAPDAKKAGK